MSLKSPYLLIQEYLRGDTWKLLIACCMLNLTSIQQVRLVIIKFFKKYPTAKEAANANINELADIIKNLGFKNRRSKIIIDLSKAYINGDDIEHLPGVGKYAYDSYLIFVKNDLSVNATDKKLKRYLEWAKSQQKQ